MAYFVESYDFFIENSCICHFFFVTLHREYTATMKIVCTTALPTNGFSLLQGEELVMPVTAKMTQEQLIAAIYDAEVLIATFDYKISKEVICAAPQLKLIANFGVGYNNIDLDTCCLRGIRVTNTPLPVIEPTAELAFALMHDVARRTSLFDRQLRLGQAEPFGVMNNLGHSLYGKTLGIIGMGRIGQALARRAMASGMTIIYHNRHEIHPAELEHKHLAAQYVTLEQLLRTADYVSLNLPYTPDVHHLIGEKELQMMKRSAYLINTARGAHVNEAALVCALQQGEIAGVAMDVYENEPAITPELLTMDNVVLSPHTGTGTWEGRIAMCENVAENILAFRNQEWNKMNIVL